MKAACSSMMRQDTGLLRRDTKKPQRTDVRTKKFPSRRCRKRDGRKEGRRRKMARARAHALDPRQNKVRRPPLPPLCSDERAGFGLVSNNHFVSSQETKRCRCANHQKHPLATHSSLPQNIALLSQETKTRRRGNLQKLNYGSLGNAPFASPEHFSFVPGDENAQARKCSKT